MIARNARESIRFIDLMISSGNYNAKEEKLMLQTPEDTGPSWKRCVTFKCRSPMVSEFPDYQPIYEVINGLKNTIGSVKKDGEVMYEQDIPSLDDKREDDVEQERINSKERHKVLGAKAELPNRYKYLLRPLIQKTHLEDFEWKFLTDDPILKIWCESFGVACINVIEADSHLFKQGLNSDVSYETNTSNDFSRFSMNDSFDTASRSLTPQSADSKKKKKNSRRRRRNNQKQSQEPTKIEDKLPAASNFRQVDSGSVRIEKYDTISYAPRGIGELWVP